MGPKYAALQEEVLGKSRKVSRPPKKTESKKTLTSFKPNQSAFTKDQADKGVLNKCFVDTLDSLEITSSTYYNIESLKPGYLHLLNWIFSKANHHDSVLVVSSDPYFLALLLKDRGIGMKQLVSPFEEMESDTQEPGQAATGFDIIVCDDLLQHWRFPLLGLQELKKRLNPNGVLLLSTRNAASGVSRLRLLTGRNVYPWFDDDTLNGSSYRNENAASFYREYTLRELNNLVSRAGFELIEKQCIIGEKKIDKSVNFAPITVKTYLMHKIYHKIQRLVPPLRSHLFVAAMNSLPKEKHHNSPDLHTQ